MLIYYDVCSMRSLLMFFFFFNDSSTTEIYTLSLHDALPIFKVPRRVGESARTVRSKSALDRGAIISVIKTGGDRKSTRLNSSHANISYAVFCLKKKKNYK